jgi:hypothetical protein
MLLLYVDQTKLQQDQRKEETLSTHMTLGLTRYITSILLYYYLDIVYSEVYFNFNRFDKHTYLFLTVCSCCLCTHSILLEVKTTSSTKFYYDVWFKHLLFTWLIFQVLNFTHIFIYIYILYKYTFKLHIMVILIQMFSILW